jgi:hypothetical protein
MTTVEGQPRGIQIIELGGALYYYMVGGGLFWSQVDPVTVADDVPHAEDRQVRQKPSVVPGTAKSVKCRFYLDAHDIKDQLKHMEREHQL